MIGISGPYTDFRILKGVQVSGILQKECEY